MHIISCTFNILGIFESLRLHFYQALCPNCLHSLFRYRIASMLIDFLSFYFSAFFMFCFPMNSLWFQQYGIANNHHSTILKWKRQQASIERTSVCSMRQANVTLRCTRYFTWPFSNAFSQSYNSNTTHAWWLTCRSIRFHESRWVMDGRCFVYRCHSKCPQKKRCFLSGKVLLRRSHCWRIEISKAIVVHRYPVIWL